jgi:hypothetical protein
MGCPRAELSTPASRRFPARRMDAAPGEAVLARHRSAHVGHPLLCNNKETGAEVTRHRGGQRARDTTPRTPTRARCPRRVPGTEPRGVPTAPACAASRGDPRHRQVGDVGVRRPRGPPRRTFVRRRLPPTSHGMRSSLRGTWDPGSDDVAGDDRVRNRRRSRSSVAFRLTTFETRAMWPRRPRLDRATWRRVSSAAR